MKFQLFEKYDPLFFQNSRKGTFALVPDWYHNMEYEREKERGYEHHESLLQPGFFEYDLREGEEIVFSCSTREVNHRSLRRDFAREKDNLIVRNSFDDCLLAASEQFIVRRNEHHQVIAGWPWFGRWGRDTFISLPGLTVATDRPELFTLVMDGMLDELKDGLFPNTGIAGQAVYNSIDAPLWCIWALQQYGYQTNDLAALWRKYSNTIRVILENYKNGTRYGIRMQENGLIRSDEENYALTWMDVIANGYPVTERSGVAVEINALWYNAVCFALEAANEYGDEQFIEHWRIYPSLIENSFIKTFWDESKGYLADYVKGDYTDWKVRPNQIIAVSVPFSPLSIDIAAKIVDVVQRELLTPRGLRSLSPLDPLYNSTYHGDQNTRDLGYHQGTVWPWLIGPFSEAYLKVNGIAGIDFIEKIYYGFEPAVFEYGLGTIAELYNGDAPHAAGGAIAQAWSVAELLRTKLLIAICRFEQEVPVKISIFSETWLKIR